MTDALPNSNIPDEPYNGEGWERLAMTLAAEEHDDIHQLIWSGGPVPEPWGEVWQKYEDEAKRMMRLVAEHTVPPHPSEAIAEVVTGNLANRLQWRSDEVHQSTPVGTLLFTNGRVLEPLLCPNCNGSGTVSVYTNNGPDAEEIDVNCPHCEGKQTLEDAYRGVVKRLAEAQERYQRATAIIWGWGSHDQLTIVQKRIQGIVEQIRPTTLDWLREQLGDLSNTIGDYTKQPLETKYGIAHTLAGFLGGFLSEHGRPATAQEIWNHAIRSWRDLNPTVSPNMPQPAPVKVSTYVSDGGWKCVNCGTGLMQHRDQIYCPAIQTRNYSPQRGEGAE